MTGKIHVLPEHVANRIAAGEVVERPASVAKELIENALDAGAKEIEVAIEESGLRSILIADNGAGMSEQDAPIAFERHATSKIESAEELERVGTFGFRGEALPSIASVSQIEMVTADNEGTGLRITLRAGEIESQEPAPRTHGTTIVVRNLFFNTPARRNFLKSDRAEERRLRRVVIAHAFADLNVSFRYVRGGEEIFHAPAGESLQARVSRILGARIGDTLVEVSGSEQGPSVAGLVSNIDSTHANRNYQYFTVNRRPVEQSLLTQAVTVAYRDLLAPRRFPAVFLSLSIDASYVDVNIHPTKREVRFAPERAVFSAVQASVRRAIRSEKSLPSFWPQRGGATTTLSPGSPRVEPGPPGLPLSGPAEWTYSDPHHPESRQGESPKTEAPDTVAEGDVVAPESWIHRVDLGNVRQLGNTFLVATGRDGIVVVDQHTAHERILFEETIDRIERSPGDSQQLLFPETVEVDPELLTIAEEYEDPLEKSGFRVRPIGPRALLLEGVPAGIREGDPAGFLREFLEQLVRESGDEKSRSRRVAASIACHGAVRAGDSLNPEESRALLERLLHCDQPLRCPHGRPTFLSISLDEIARRFLRT